MGNKLKPLTPPPKRSEENIAAKAEAFSSIVEGVETKSKYENEIADLKQVLEKLDAITARLENAGNYAETQISAIKESISALIILNNNVQIAAKNIDSTVRNASNTTFEFKLQPKYKEQLEAYNRNVVDQEKSAREDLLYKERELLSDHFYRLSNLMHNKEGTWLSKKVFFIWMVSTFILVFIIVAIITIWVSYYN